MGTPKYSLREVIGLDKEPTLFWLQRKCLPDDKIVEATEDSYWWVLYQGRHPVGFAGLSPVANWPTAGYMCRAGVLREHRGHGLQRRLIKARIRKARALGWSYLITTTYDNPQSANNLIKMGFKMYTPADRWGADGTCYWIKDLTK